MRHRSLLSACAALAMLTALPALAEAPAAPTAQAAEPAFTYTDMLNANRLSDPRVSPDGRHVVYNVRATDMEANRGVSSLMIQALTGEGEPRRLAISDGGANTARWGSDRPVLPLGPFGVQPGLEDGLDRRHGDPGHRPAAGRQCLSPQPRRLEGRGVPGRLPDLRRSGLLGRARHGSRRPQVDGSGL